jgi:hypothetical protein
VKQCPRCNHWHHSKDSDVCTVCWEDMGQMTFVDLSVEEYEPPIDTVFDREEEARGYL